VAQLSRAAQARLSVPGAILCALAIACVDTSRPDNAKPSDASPACEWPLEAEDIVSSDADPVPEALRTVGITGPYAWNNVVIRGGGFVTGLVFSKAAPNLLYARTDVGGAYRYNTSEQVWVPLTDWIGQANSNLYGIESIAADPGDASRVYLAAGTYLNAGDGKMLASSDFGRNFTEYAIPVAMGGNEPGRSMGERLAVDPNQSEIVYFGSRNDGLWKSTNRSETWTRVGAFPVAGDARFGLPFVIFDAASGQRGTATPTLYVAVATLAGATLYRSTDAGSSFEPVPGAPTELMPHHASIDANKMYVAYNDGSGPNGKRDDNDVTGIRRGEVWRLEMVSGEWSNISPPTNGGGFGGLSVDASRPGTLMVSTIDWWAPDTIFRSLDGGNCWHELGQRSVRRDARGAEWLRFGGNAVQGTGWMGDLEIDPFNRSRVLYVTGQGVWRSDNVTHADARLPTNWEFRSDGLEETVALDLACPPDGPYLLSAVGDIAGFRHDELDAPSPKGMYVNPVFGNTTSIDFAESDPRLVVRVGTNSNGRRGAYSTNGGETWTPFASEPADGNGSGSIAVSADGKTLLWSAQGTRERPSTVAYSNNNGESWSAAATIQGSARVAADRVNAQKFYAVNRQGLHVSTDGGKSFALTQSAMNGGANSSRVRPVFGIEGDVWLILDGQLRRSTDSGASMTPVANVESALAIGFGRPAVEGDYPAVYLVGRVDGAEGIFRSDDEGESFVRISDEEHQFGYIGHITGDQRQYGRVYLGTDGRGIIYGDPATPAD
jgi:hypothetical protein